MKKILIILLLVCAFPLMAGELFNARIYSEQDSEKLAYTHNNTVTIEGDSTIINHYYYTSDGQLYVLDKVVLFNGEPIFNSLKFYQINEYSSLERKGDKVILNYQRGKKKKQATRKYRNPLVFAPIQQDAIKKNMHKLLKGEAVTFYIFAAEVLRLVEMRVTLIESSSYDREDCYVLQMKPDNFLIDWLVDEVYYVVNKSTYLIEEMHGFSTLRQEIDGNWEYRDMDFYYSYE